MFSLRHSRLALAILLASARAGAADAPKAPQAPKAAGAPKLDVARLSLDLRSGDSGRIERALEEIGRAGPEGVALAQPLSELLVRGASVEIVRKAISVAGGIGASELSPALAQYVRHRAPEVRQLAVRALVATGGPSAVEALRRALRGSDPALRELAATGLGGLGARQALPDLVAALDHRVFAAARSIGQLCAGEACERFLGRLGKLPLEVVTDGLEPMLFRPESDVPTALKLEIIDRVSLLGTEPAQGWLKGVLRTWPAAGDPKVKKALEKATDTGATEEAPPRGKPGAGEAR